MVGTSYGGRGISVWALGWSPHPRVIHLPHTGGGGGEGKNMDGAAHDERNVVWEVAKNMKCCCENCCTGKPSGSCGNEVKGATISP